MNIFLTGGTGFIGSYVAMELARLGHQVTILARNANKVPELKKIPQFEIVEGDITDTKLLERLVRGQDVCILVALNYTKKTGWEVLQDDTFPTVFIADIAAGSGVKQLIYTSSTSVNDSLYRGGAAEMDPALRVVTASTKQRPATFYGATKASSENYLLAQSYHSSMRVNIIRPGYTFGNPVVPGASTEGDARFQAIVRAALAGQPIRVVRNDGTQFIWAGDLARVYSAVLDSQVNRKTYFGLSKGFISWEAIAGEAVRRCGSHSPIEVEERGWSPDGLTWDVSDIKKDFGLEFDGWVKIGEHLEFYLSLEKDGAMPLDLRT